MKTKLLLLALLSVFLLAGCNSKEQEKEPMTEPTPTTEVTPTEEATPTPTETLPSPTPTPFPDMSFSETFPGMFGGVRRDQTGTIVSIEYPTYDYYQTMEPITKPAYVYLPYGYDESKQYNVLYLMHGIGGNEREWGMTNDAAKIKCIMDNLAAFGIIEPFIVVTPNGRSYKDFANTGGDMNSFYSFGQELRNDLIPYIDANFATYAEYSEDGYDLTAARDHRAMAGLSMGGMQTINIGLCECLDIMSYFGAFSAAPTSYETSKIVDILNTKFPDEEIHYVYSLCGTEDYMALASASAALENLAGATDRVVDGESFTWQTVKGVHDFRVWNLGFFNFAQVVFK